MSYFLKSPIGSVGLALTIFKLSLRYFSLIVISSADEYTVSDELSTRSAAAVDDWAGASVKFDDDDDVPVVASKPIKK